MKIETLLPSEQDYKFAQQIGQLIIAECPEVNHVFWFGSRSKGVGTNLSDFDICILVDKYYFSIGGVALLNSVKLKAEKKLIEAGFLIGKGPGEVDLGVLSDIVVEQYQDRSLGAILPSEVMKGLLVAQRNKHV